MKNQGDSDLSPRYRWVILGVNMAAHAGVIMAGLALAPLAPFVLGDLASSRTELGMLISALLVGGALGSTPGGWLADRSIRMALVGGQVLLATMVLLVSQVSSFETALLFLAMGGLGFGAVITTAARAVSSWFPGHARATALGMVMAAAPLGNMIISMVMPALGEAWGWRQALAPVALFLLVSAVASGLLFRPSPVEASPMHGVSSGRTSTWAALRQRDPWLLTLVAILMGLSEHAFRSYFLLYVTEVVLLPVVLGGWLLALAHGSGLVGRVGWGVISDRWFAGDREGVFAILALLGSVSTALIGLGWGAPWSLPMLALLFGLTGSGWVGVWTLLLLDRAKSTSAGKEIGFAMSFTYVGIIAGPYLFGRGVDMSGSYQAMWLLVALGTAPSIVIMLVLRNSRRRRQL